MLQCLRSRRKGPVDGLLSYVPRRPSHRYTNFDEMKIGRDRKHPKRADTFINYYDSNSDGHIHKAEFNAKHEL